MTSALWNETESTETPSHLHADFVELAYLSLVVAVGAPLNGILFKNNVRAWLRSRRDDSKSSFLLLKVNHGFSDWKTSYNHFVKSIWCFLRSGFFCFLSVITLPSLALFREVVFYNLTVFHEEVSLILTVLREAVLPSLTAFREAAFSTILFPAAPKRIRLPNPGGARGVQSDLAVHLSVGGRRVGV